MPPRFREAVAALRAHYGKPAPPISTDPFALIVYESIAYLVSDEKRDLAFDTLRRDACVTPRAVLKARMAILVEACRIGGIHPERRAERIRLCAEIVISEFDGDLRTVLQLPYKDARKALCRLPGIGEPGADKILLFCGSYPVLAPESNGLRVLTRLGFTEDKPSYAATYRSALAAIEDEAGDDCARLTVAHQLLRRHGRELCRRSQPLCPQCPLRSGCDYAART